MDCEAAKYQYLVDEFCENDEERQEMISWMEQIGIDEAFRIIQHLFNDDEDNRSKTLPMQD